MKTSLEMIEPTVFKLTITADAAEIDEVKKLSIQKLAANIKVSGFRAGKAPANLVEKQIDQVRLQTEVIDEVVNRLYSRAITQEKLRPVKPPEVSITKFVPFTTLEFVAQADAVGEIVVGEYKKIRLPYAAPSVKADEITRLIDNLRMRKAEKEPVKRAAKNGDEAVIDFSGVDAETKKPIEGAAGNDYPLVLGSNNFIPGFEEELVGLKAGDSKTFKIKFPKDYSVKSLQNRPVEFSVSLKTLNSVKLPKLDDEFARSIGPFKSLAELKGDAKKELVREKEVQVLKDYENALLERIAETSQVEIPGSIVEQENIRTEDEEKRDLTYRGETWQEHLASEGITEEQHRERNRPAVINRIKIGLLLGEIAERENISVSDAELANRIGLLKQQYQDGAMQAELDKPENRNDVRGRLLTEKTLELLVTQAKKTTN